MGAFADEDDLAQSRNRSTPLKVKKLARPEVA